MNDIQLKLNIPNFDGHLHIEDLDWEMVVKTFFDYIEVSFEKEVKYVACKLKGGFGAWLAQFVKNYKWEEKGLIRSWQQMKHYLHNHFLPSDF